MYYSKDDYDNYRKGKADEECKQYFDRHKKDLKKEFLTVDAWMMEMLMQSTIC